MSRKWGGRAQNKGHLVEQAREGGSVRAQGIQCQNEAFQFGQLNLRYDTEISDLETCPGKPSFQDPEITHSEFMWPRALEVH